MSYTTPIASNSMPELPRHHTISAVVQQQKKLLESNDPQNIAEGFRNVMSAMGPLQNLIYHLGEKMYRAEQDGVLMLADPTGREPGLPMNIFRMHRLDTASGKQLHVPPPSRDDLPDFLKDMCRADFPTMPSRAVLTATITISSQLRPLLGPSLSVTAFGKMIHNQAARSHFVLTGSCC